MVRVPYIYNYGQLFLYNTQQDDILIFAGACPKSNLHIQFPMNRAELLATSSSSALFSFQSL